MRAVVEAIAEVGYARTTAAEISRRAGVTWGAVQHHFGDKEGILMAVLRESFERFAALLEDVPEGEPLEKRAALFVERAWAHVSGDAYRSTFEILLNLPPDLELRWQREVLDAWHRIWRRYFPESDPRKRETTDLMQYTIASLSGLAATGVLTGGASRRNRALGYLRDTLVRDKEGFRPRVSGFARIR